MAPPSNPWSDQPPGHERLRGLLWLLLCLQAAAAFWLTKPWLTADSEVYLTLASGLGGLGFGRMTPSGFEADALRPPGYPIILNLLVDRLGLPIGAVVALQLAVYLLAIGLIERFLRRRQLPTIPFLLVAVLYPFGAIYSAYVMGEAWATLCLTAVALLLMGRDLPASKLVLAGGIAGVATLIRSDMALLPILIAGIVLVGERKRRSGLAFRAAIPIIAASVVISPYAIWNLSHFGRLMPTPAAAAVGNSLYLAPWQRKLPQRDLAALYQGAATERAQSTGLADEVRRVNRSFGAPDLVAPFNPAAYPTQAMQIQSTLAFRSAAVERIKDDPLAYAGHVSANLWGLWNSSAYPASVPWFVKWALMLVSAVAWAAGLFGAALGLQRVRGFPLGGAGAVILLYTMFVHLPLHTEARYTAAARPLLLLYGTFALRWLWCQFRVRGGRQSPSPQPSSADL